MSNTLDTLSDPFDPCFVATLWERPKKSIPKEVNETLAAFDPGFVETRWFPGRKAGHRVGGTESPVGFADTCPVQKIDFTLIQGTTKSQPLLDLGGMSRLEPIKPEGGYRLRSITTDRPYGTHGKCKAMCPEEAEYQMPNGLQLCGGCAADYIDRLASNVNLPGERCDWEHAHQATYNLYDGKHDWLEDLNRPGADCNHTDCSRKRRQAREKKGSRDAS